MIPSRVVILSANPLFREGLIRLLGKEVDLHLVGTVSTIEEATRLMEQQPVDVIIVENKGEGELQSRAIEQLLALPRQRVHLVALSLDDAGMQLYHREQLSPASVKSLLSALKRAPKQ